MAGRQAERFREVQSKIDSYLILFPVISHIGITRRLDRIYNVLVQQDDSTSAELPQSSTQLQEGVVPPGAQEFTFAEIMAATNNFSRDTLIDFSSFGRVYRGRLHDGREVAVKRMDIHSSNSLEEFHMELNILSRLQNKHIVRLLGSCVTVSKDKSLQATTLKKIKGLLTSRRNEPEKPERLIVYEYMQNRTLFDHLHPGHGSSELSPVTLSWKLRIDVLLGVSRAMEHLHCHANPPIIHRDIKSANILFDANWVPRVSDFGLSVIWDMASDESGMEISLVVGTYGYMAPEYATSGRLSRACDVYSLGVLMLEVLTGKLAHLQRETFGASPNVRGLSTGSFQSGDEMNIHTDLPSLAIPIIEDGNLGELLDRRPVPEPTPWQLQALERVAWTARCCLKLDAKDRLAISDVVANLEMAHKLICRDEPGSADVPGSFDELPDSPRASSVYLSCYQSDPESEVLEERR